MAENSTIEWTDHTFNPWTGCTKVSPACDHCYAESWAKRSGHVTWGPHGARRRTSPANWRQPIKWNAAAEAAGRRHLKGIMKTLDAAPASAFAADAGDGLARIEDEDFSIV